jgi:peptidoglycan/xylan/chitin deacetylase (PgdA/CDA1 family)
VLSRHDAKATFFVVGRAAEAHAELVRRIRDEGHLIASHGYRHASTFHFWRAKTMADDLARGVETIERITGERPGYFRPPHGLRVPTLAKALVKLGARLAAPAPRCVTWTVRGMDSVARTPESIIARIEPGLTGGAIVALHDGTNYGGRKSREPTVLALDILLARARAKGLACVRLDELLDHANPDAGDGR